MRIPGREFLQSGRGGLPERGAWGCLCVLIFRARALGLLDFRFLGRGGIGGERGWFGSGSGRGAAADGGGLGTRCGRSGGGRDRGINFRRFGMPLAERRDSVARGLAAHWHGAAGAAAVANALRRAATRAFVASLDVAPPPTAVCLTAVLGSLCAARAAGEGAAVTACTRGALVDRRMPEGRTASC